MNYLDFIASKIYTIETIKPLLSVWRFKQEKIVFTNGCFDIIHLGHIDYLSKAAALGTRLVLGLNSDESIRRLKGETRPVIAQESRVLTLASMIFIDAVIVFNEDTPYDLISIVQPDILVKGGDYKKEDIVGYDIVKNKGGEIITIDLVQGYSTTTLINKQR